MDDLLLEDGRIVAPDTDTVSAPVDVRIIGGKIVEIGIGLDKGSSQRIACGGRFMLPGLIDCHVHPFLADANIARLGGVPPTLMRARASRILEGMRQRGFTTVGPDAAHPHMCCPFDMSK